MSIVGPTAVSVGPFVMFTALAIGLGTASPVVAQTTAASAPYIVTLTDASSPDQVAALARQDGAKVTHIYRRAMTGFAARMTAAAVEHLRADTHVVSIQADEVVSGAGQALTAGARRVHADQSPTADIDGVDERVDADIAVLDTGIDVDHPDLNVVGGVNCLGGTSYDDDSGHGTHVAGVAAAIDNNIGVVGVAPGARLWAVKVLDAQDNGTWSSVICGIDWVTSMAGTIEVANMSLTGTKAGGQCPRTPLHQAICDSVAAGVTYVAAAGNFRSDANRYAPATFREVITVSALADYDGLPGGLGTSECGADADDNFANFSNYGDDIDLIAPGVCVRSTWKGGLYKVASGTSMSAPFVSGAAALYLSKHPGTTPAEVRVALRAAATYDWNTSTDLDDRPDRLLNVSGL
jgi:subtilisin family serine protease